MIEESLNLFLCNSLKFIKKKNAFYYTKADVKVQILSITGKIQGNVV